jgi:protein transport protein SEC24
MPLVYGRLVPVHRVLEAALELSPAGDAPVAASQLDTLPLSSANVDPEGVYLLENGAEAWLYFGGDALPALVADLLGECAASGPWLGRSSDTPSRGSSMASEQCSCL